jgi:hypothetical protein
VRKAESTALKVANVTAPVLIKLQGPIGTLDGVLCVGLDYVERKLPAVKLPPNEVGLCIFFGWKQKFINISISGMKHKMLNDILFSELY